MHICLSAGENLISSARRHRVRGGADRLLRRLLLQRHHRVGPAVLHRLLCAQPAVDLVWKRLEHGKLQACESVFQFEISNSKHFTLFMKELLR
jgi:hypothetical protein